MLDIKNKCSLDNFKKNNCSILNMICSIFMDICLIYAVLSQLGECDLGEFFVEKALVGESVFDEYLFHRKFFCPNLFMSNAFLLINYLGEQPNLAK
jgi:hypothetical protein